MSKLLIDDHAEAICWTQHKSLAGADFKVLNDVMNTYPEELSTATASYVDAKHVPIKSFLNHLAVLASVPRSELQVQHASDPRVRVGLQPAERPACRNSSDDVRALSSTLYRACR